MCSYPCNGHKDVNFYIQNISPVSKDHYGNSLFYLHIRDDVTQTLGRQACPRAHGNNLVGPGRGPRSLWPQGHALTNSGEFIMEKQTRQQWKEKKTKPCFICTGKEKETIF